MCHMHEHYKNKWKNDRSKFRPKYGIKEPKQKHKCYNKKKEVCKTKIWTKFCCDEIKKHKQKNI